MDIHNHKIVSSGRGDLRKLGMFAEYFSMIRKRNIMALVKHAYILLNAKAEHAHVWDRNTSLLFSSLGICLLFFQVSWLPFKRTLRKVQKKS